MLESSTYRQIGIVSYGYNDCTADKASVQSRVTDNLDFIENVIRQTTRPQGDPQTISYETNPQINSQYLTIPQNSQQTKPTPSSSSVMNMLRPLSSWQRN